MNEPTSLYTFVLDFEGGTYISQVKAHDLKTAKVSWLAQLNIQSIPNFTEYMKEEILSGLNLENDVEVTGLIGVWCCSFLSCERFGLVHAIKTDCR